MIRNNLIALAAISLAMLLGACATEPVVQQTGADATVTNRTGRIISSLAYQTCGSGAASWSTLPVPSIAPQATVPFRLPAPCVNLRAYYDDGQVAGMHNGVKWDFPLSWVLS